MRILVGYMATSSAWERFVQAQLWQELVGPAGQFDRIVVSETAHNVLSGIATVVEPRGEQNGIFNLAAMRNRILQKAIAGKYDGFIVLEADFIVLRWFSAFPPAWAIPYAVYSNSQTLPFVDLPVDYKIPTIENDWKNLGGRPLIPVHCVLVNSSMYSVAHWDEEYEGNGYDDWDFYETLLASGNKNSFTDMLLVHRWHPSSGLTPRAENAKRFESKWGPLAKHCNHEQPQ
jgi:hypothetical protein